MRVVILCPSLYSETSCAMAVRLARSGYTPAGAVVLSTFDLRTLIRKVGQWGFRNVVRYGRSKLLSPSRAGEQFHNPHLAQLLRNDAGNFRNLREVAARYRFPILTCKDQNAPDAIAQLNQWSPDLIVFTGGNILRKQLLRVPRLGVINAHLGLLPQIRGMNTPEWSLLTGIPVGVTVHHIDAGIDTGAILKTYEFPDASECSSLDDLRNRLIALGVEKIAEVVAALDRGVLSAMPQSETSDDNQYFVMHQRLQAQAARRLSDTRFEAAPMRAHG